MPRRSAPRYMASSPAPASSAPSASTRHALPVKSWPAAATFPSAPGTSPCSRLSFHRRASSSEPSPARKRTMPTVAIVEDNADNRLLLQAILGDQYTLVEYENGVDALAGLARERPDLVLLDISLPGMDGTQILKRIRDDVALRSLP